ncbi:MAG: sigma-54-dependent Fis family transcriptional regulator [Candidatus Cloacimonadota bacterium]|nr:MAG: sigma-54-dependent Fis family transcriptional regulator [Candidatus Cloacimonadota bacterium]
MEREMRFLIVDDDELIRDTLRDFIEQIADFEVDDAPDGWRALDLIAKKEYDIILSDIMMPGISGIELLRQIKKTENGKNSDVIIMTGFRNIDNSIAALRAGAADYLHKPLNSDELSFIINRIAEKKKLDALNRMIKRNLGKRSKLNEEQIRNRFNNFKTQQIEMEGIGKVGLFSSTMKEIVKLADKFHSERNIPVLIQGETGTGKEIISRIIHYGSEQKGKGPLISLNCSSISPSLFESELFGYDEGAFTGAQQKGRIGKLELAQNGTLFLDEIGDFPIEMQPKLLRVLQEKEMYRVGSNEKIKLNVRFIFATNQDLISKIKDGSFRKDLYYRINIGNVFIPPLRERQSEIEDLSNMFLLEFSELRNRKFKKLSTSALELLQNYSWPGNVRELRNTIERITVLHDGEEVYVKHLDFLISPDTDDFSAEGNMLSFNLPDDRYDLSAIESKIINKVMKMFDNNKTKVAAYLNISRNTLLKKLRDSN